MDISITFNGLDIHTTIVVAVIFLIIIGIILFTQGKKVVDYGTQITYFQKRKVIIQRGWFFILVALFLGVVAVFLGQFGEDIIYQIYPPSPTITQTPTITLTPTISPTPTLTLTPTLTITPAISSTPSLSEEILSEFSAVITPNYDALFSPLVFAFAIDEGYQPVNPAYEFTAPISEMFAAFSFDQMQPGSQWTAVWLNPNREVICYETSEWGGYTGGYGYAQCELSPNQWVPGTYEVQIFLGEDWKTSGRFSVLSDEIETPVVETTPEP